MPTGPFAALQPSDLFHPHYVTDTTNVIQPGDQLQYQVLEDQDPPVFLKVDASGYIIVPYYGSIKVAEHTPTEAITLIKHRLESTDYKTATILIQLQAAPRTKRFGTVYLSGRFNRIGPIQFDLEEGTTLSRAILSAGGFSEFANTKKVRVIRKSGKEPDQEIVVNVDTILEKGRREQDVSLQDGDLIIAPQKLFNW